MRTLIAIAFLLFTPTSLGEVKKNDITVLQVNAYWNKEHNLNLKNLKGCDVQFAWLEDQNQDFQKQIQTVPVVVIYYKNKAVRQWAADLSFKLDIDINEIQQVVDKL
jgi:hypothetical protein